jgi:membrane protease subunit HflC
MRPISILSIFVFLFFLVILFSSMFTISEGEHGIFLRLGRLVENKQDKQIKIVGPGLHFKWPMIETVRVFDTRLQTLDIQSSRIVTKEKKDVMVDYYVKWRIRDIAKYFKSTGGNVLKAETLLEQQLNTYLRAAFGRRTISDLVSGGRDDVMDTLKQKAEEQARELGISVVDVRLKGIELPESTSNAVYQRMRADMQKIANRHRADGQATSSVIKSKADARITILLAEAKSKGQTLRATGQSIAASIYANAYNQNTTFYAYYRSLKAYESSFQDPQSILVLDQSNAFFEYFKHPLTMTKKAG